jgi:hypothetical protein
MNEVDPFQELRAALAAADALAKEPEAFEEAYKAFLATDAGLFQAVLDRVNLGHECHRICHLFCKKRCIARCYRLCPERPEQPVEAVEIREFVEAFSQVARNKQVLGRLASMAEKEDVKGWQAELKQHGLERFCHQICHFLCRERCKLICRELCLRPDITRISSIPTPQFGPLGLGNGPGVPPFHVDPPNPAQGRGDHPIGDSSWLMGVFNVATATQYKVEVSSTGLPGSYSPIKVPVEGYNFPPPPPPPPYLVRLPDPGGWYNVGEIFLSDGGPTPVGEKTLLYWPTPGDGTYYLRLVVRDGVERVGAPRIVRVDNTWPPTPLIALELKTPSGELKPLKCGKVKKGDGLIRITIEAHDPNFSAVSVVARGNSSLSVPIEAVPDPGGGSPISLSKTYNGDITDTGYPVPTSFLWDPWSDPRIVPCCYVVHIVINDRTVRNDFWSSGHVSEGWEAIEIGF